MSGALGADRRRGLWGMWGLLVNRRQVPVTCQLQRGLAFWRTLLQPPFAARHAVRHLHAHRLAGTQPPPHVPRPCFAD